MAGPADTYEGYGYGWATVSNTPFRMYKHFVHEGGISTPLIAHWPNGIQRPGQWEHTTGHIIDLLPTLLNVANGTPLKERKGQVTKELEGVSLLPLFSAKPVKRDTLYWEHEGNRAIREGNWKLVSQANQPWELYDISQDRSEQRDLSGKNPELVKRLAAKWQSYADRTGVIDWSLLNSSDSKP